jgi:hypothetical protein
VWQSTSGQILHDHSDDFTRTGLRLLRLVSREGAGSMTAIHTAATDAPDLALLAVCLKLAGDDAWLGTPRRGPGSRLARILRHVVMAHSTRSGPGCSPQRADGPVATAETLADPVDAGCRLN